MVLKFGLFGLLIYGILAFKFFHRMLLYKRSLAPGPMRIYMELGIITFGATQAYLFGYGLEPISLIFFSIALVAAELSKRERAAAPTVTNTATFAIPAPNDDHGSRWLAPTVDGVPSLKL